MSHGSSTRGMGTYYFMAPEVMNDEKYDTKADIWSIGCTIVELLTARPPWYPLNQVRVIKNMTTGVYPIYKLPAPLSEDVERLLKQCFQQNPLHRPTADEMLQMDFCKSS